MPEDYKQIGRQKHKVFGSVDTFMKVSDGTIHYMMPKCPGCGCNNVLSSSVVKSLCIECGSLRNRFYTYMSIITKYNNTHIHIASDNRYRQLESIVDEYKRRRDAGFNVPGNLDQAIYMTEYWRRNKNGM
jgi:hypothetical protein